MASKQSKILNKTLDQKKDEVKKMEEFVKEGKTKEMDLERQYQENYKVHFVFSLFIFLFFFFFQAKLTHFFIVLIQRHKAWLRTRQCGSG